LCVGVVIKLFYSDIIKLARLWLKTVPDKKERRPLTDSLFQFE